VAFLLFAAHAFAAVTVTSPAAGSTLTSPVHYVATSTASTCAKGVATMGIYVNNVLVYVGKGASLNYQLALGTGAQHTVVQEWDYCKGSTYKTINLTVVAAPTVGISASSTSITSGGSSTLTVTATNATTVTLTGTDGSAYTLAATGGTEVVRPVSTTTYTATATGAGGAKTSSSTTVTVSAAATPTIGIIANPATVASGGPSTLTVTAANATTVTITGSDGSSYTLTATGGAQVVDPTSTTTYTATATGTGGKTTAAAVVTVAPVPTVGITANPTTVASGAPSTLTVTAANATTVTITGSDNSSYALTATGGAQVVSPTSTTTYTATATGTGGKTTATATVTVAGAPTVTVTAKPTSINSGSSSTLTVTAANATTVTITGTDSSSYNLTATGGTQVVSPASTTTYTATATGTGGKTKATTTVTVNQPATVTITAKPTSITSGSSSTLTVTAANATGVTVTGSDSSSYTLTATGGNQIVNPTSTTTYTATAAWAGGNVTANTTVTVTAAPAPTVTIRAKPTSIYLGGSSTLTVAATNATQVTVTGTDNSSYTLEANGGTQSVSPTSTTTYTAQASGPGGNTSANAVVTLTPAGSTQSINHVIFMLQENHTFDAYLGMLNPYRLANGWNVGDDGNTYTVDGIDDKLNTISNQDDEGTSFSLFKFATTCIDDDSSAWLASYGDINRYDFLATRPINMDGFVHTGEGYAKSCAASGTCTGAFTDLTGERAMGYYDQGFLNYYYYMASQFAVSNRWFSPVSSKSVPNRIATFSGGTTVGLVNDPGNDDHLPTLTINTIFEALDKAKVSWKIYYTVTDGYCLEEDDCSGTGIALYPSTSFSKFSYSYQYIYGHSSGVACISPTQPSSVVGDASNSFCIDPNKIAPVSQYYTDLANGTLPSFAFIEAGFGINDEHPGSAQSILNGQAEVANIVNSLMTSSSWSDSVFFLSYDEGGGPYDHVPPVPGHSNDNTDASLGSIPDISSIAVDPDGYNPCVPPTPGTPTAHCDLSTSSPGANPGDAPAVNGFAAQLGFRLPNMVISPFTRKHYVSNIPMDHTAVIRFVEDRFIGNHQYLTARDAAQPNLLDFFDFNNVPWATPPAPPVPASSESLGYNPCTPGSMGP
jgi:phospholipase C